MAKRESAFLGVDWWGVARLVVPGTLGCLALSLLLNYALLFGDDIHPFNRSLITAVVIPLVVAVPLFSLLALMQGKIRRLVHEVNHLSAFDRVTQCVTGSAFSSLVDSSVAVERRRPAQHNQGALLVIDVEHLTSLNVRFGHNWGDEALRCVASVIRSSVRSSDVVGRVGVSEFGVFLPGASEENAVEVGERIRAAVANAYFAPQGVEQVLSVSIGGVIYRDEVYFAEMFRAAEQQMFQSKTIAPGRLELSHLSSKGTGNLN
ncbi:GGDEF domain-containing protein [Mesorhizobium sp. L-8-3]|uniref:GGDEF domain-containing protein n=1 Tax=Mesorhizobium sp. L-8-3 TaxID=2744522 RepID=UPI001927F20D|nr:GGDEF domain-containing protein [Mesorhizobium sp. L-8-3]BCH20838.1 GGDEF domain-containing protein [Mesorhizobium sp. L-8-3]